MRIISAQCHIESKTAVPSVPPYLFLPIFFFENSYRSDPWFLLSLSLYHPSSLTVSHWTEYAKTKFYSELVEEDISVSFGCKSKIKISNNSAIEFT